MCALLVTCTMSLFIMSLWGLFYWARVWCVLRHSLIPFKWINKCIFGRLLTSRATSFPCVSHYYTKMCCNVMRVVHGWAPAYPNRFMHSIRIVIFILCWSDIMKLDGKTKYTQRLVAHCACLSVCVCVRMHLNKRLNSVSNVFFFVLFKLFRLAFLIGPCVCMAER